MHLGETLYTANVVDIEESADIEEATVASSSVESVTRESVTAGASGE